MEIKRIIDGKEIKIELSKQEMIDIAHQLEILNIVDGLDDYMSELEIENYDDEVQAKYQEYLDAPLDVCEKFWRECAEEIIVVADERCISLCDDLTDIFGEVIIDKLMKFEREEKHFD
jgi:hypothetical protein